MIVSRLQHNQHQLAHTLVWLAMQAVYGVLKEAEHRSTFYLPYWNLPFAADIVPRQRAFRRDLAVINECLDGLIAQAKRTRNADDAEALQSRDYSKVCRPIEQPPMHALCCWACAVTWDCDGAASD